MVWQPQLKNGIWLPQIGWALDATKSVPAAIVSHAHSDHIGRHRELVCSPPTARFIHARLPGRRIEHVLRFGQCEALTPDCSVTLHPAGHILGSSMIELRGAPGVLLYTGDFKLRSGLAAEACVAPRADTLIMETTFGLPRYELPPDADVIADIIQFCQTAVTDGAVPVLYCYSLGKSQEVLQALAPAGLPIMLHAQTLRMTRIYEACGQVFPPYREFDADEVGGHVVICPPPHNKTGLLRRIPAPRTAIISGWAMDRAARYRYGCDAAFPLSDHADFPDLLRMVELVQPKRVFTVHGYAVEFAQTLRSRGWDAVALGRENQLELTLAGRS